MYRTYVVSVCQLYCAPVARAVESISLKAASAEVGVVLHRELIARARAVYMGWGAPISNSRVSGRCKP